MRARRTILVLLVIAAAGCNLKMTPPTPVPTAAPPTVEPSSPIIIVPPGTPVNPNCPVTPPNWIAYSVEAGDSLGLLAEQTGSTIADLVAANCLDNPDSIFAGQILFLPSVPAAQ